MASDDDDASSLVACYRRRPRCRRMWV